MDEPLSNLDALLRLEMRAELKKLLADIKCPTIYVTRPNREALSMGDRIAVMKRHHPAVRCTWRLSTTCRRTNLSVALSATRR